MKYIVSWVITSMVEITCPINKKVDEFGRETFQQRQYMVACWETRVTPHKKEFSNYDSAIAFYNRARGNVDKLKLDSISK